MNRDIFNTYCNRTMYPFNLDQIEYLVNNIETLLHFAIRHRDLNSNRDGGINHIISYSFIPEVKKNKAKGIFYLQSKNENIKNVINYILNSGEI